jgi:WD40 repeat protein
MPLVLEGHTQEVECIATDSNTIASTCLAGHIRIWDSISGEQLAHIDRRQFFSGPQKNLNATSLDADELMSDYESGSPPSRGEMEAALGLYSSVSAIHQGRLSHAYNVQRSTSYNNNNTHKRRSMGNALDYDYQINEFGSDNKYIQKLFRRSLDSAYDLPDLKPEINMKFSSIKYTPSQKNYDQGFDFGERYRTLMEQHNKSIEEMQKSETRDNVSIGRLNISDSTSSINTDRTITSHVISAIWCMDYQENLIVVGCANGSLEFWEGTTGKFKVSHEILNKYI